VFPKGVLIKTAEKVCEHTRSHSFGRSCHVVDIIGKGGALLHPELDWRGSSRQQATWTFTFCWCL